MVRQPDDAVDHEEYMSDLLKRIREDYQSVSDEDKHYLVMEGLADLADMIAHLSHNQDTIFEHIEMLVQKSTY